MQDYDTGMVEKRTYTPNEVAVILGISVRTVYSLCESTKDFRVLRMGKRCVRIHKESFDRWIENETCYAP